MRLLTNVLAAAFCLGLSIGANADVSDMPGGKYELEKTHGYITFTYDHLGFSRPQVGFDNFDAEFDFDADDITNSMISVSIDASSINSRVAEFDEHLNGEKFFDTANHPMISFASSGIKVLEDNKLTIDGELTIRGITKTVTLHATINKAGNHPMRKVPTFGISATAKVSRSDFGMTTAVPVVGDEISIYIETEMIQSN